MTRFCEKAEVKRETTDMNDKEKELIEKIDWNKIKSITECIAGTAVIIAPVIYAFYYLYQWGYCKQIKVDINNIEAVGISVLYKCFLCLGAAALFIFSNYAMYIKIKKKEICKSVFIIVYELLIYIAYIFLLTNSGFLEIMKEIFYNKKEMVFFLFSSILMILCVNAWGIYVGIHEQRKAKKMEQESEGVDEELKKPNKIWKMKDLLFFSVGMVIIFGIIMIIEGQCQAKIKRGYKVLIEQVSDEETEEVADKYLFTQNGNSFRMYPIIYSTKDRYIISYLCKSETGIYIEFARQKIIGVEDVETVYISDIYEIK